MGSKERFIEYAGEHQPTVLEFREKIANSKSIKSQKIESNPSLLNIIANPEKLFTDEMSQLLTSESLQKLPSPTLEKVRVRAKGSIARIKANIKLETDYLIRYHKLMESLNKAVHKRDKG